LSFIENQTPLLRNIYENGETEIEKLKSDYRIAKSQIPPVSKPINKGCVKESVSLGYRGVHRVIFRTLPCPALPCSTLLTKEHKRKSVPYPAPLSG
jgi:hypothetical protein